MDEVLAKFENTLISKESNEESKTNFESLYKNWGKLGNQEERRKEILEVQKSNRNTKLDRFRGILELVNAVEGHQIFQSHKAFYRPTIYVAGFNKVSPTYSNVLMMSEWMIEKPADFNENWYVVPCPKGVRMLVVASHGKTKYYTKYGHFTYENRTVLPGGNPSFSKYKNQCCVLDCFYNEKINTMFVLDLLAWNNQPMTDGETEFRHYWLETQLADLPDLKVVNKKNETVFKILPKIPCDPESFTKFMSTHPPFPDNCPPIDGLLFYHKKAHYVSGQTPLVGWLFPFMVPEVLGSDISLHAMYSIEKPETYENQADFIQKFETKHAKRKSRSRRTSTNAMDTADITRHEEQPKQQRPPKKIDSKNTKQTPNNAEVMEAEEIQTEAQNDSVEPEATNNNTVESIEQ